MSALSGWLVLWVVGSVLLWAVGCLTPTAAERRRMGVRLEE